MPNTLPKPSPHLKSLIETELGKPQYQGEDEDIAMIEALRAIIAEHGTIVFDPLNSTDQTLLILSQED